MEVPKIIRLILFSSFLLFLGKPVYSFEGHLDTKVVYFPNKENLLELRNKLLLEEKGNPSDWSTFYFGCRVDGLISDKGQENNRVVVKVDDAYLGFYLPRVEVKMGYTKLFWGKFDQLAPTDIVNPLDISKLFLNMERKEAKLPIWLFMVSPCFTEGTRLDLVLVPFFEKGSYDELNERSSPFNIPSFSLPIEEELPARNLENMEYGIRFSNTFYEVDWSCYYFRGFYDFPSYSLYNKLNKINAKYFKSNMFGYDFELVKGKWGIKGEGSLHTNQYFQKEKLLDYVEGDFFTGGLGVDRSFGDNYLNFCVLYKKIFTDDAIEERKDEITFIAGIERKFSYETKAMKFFSLYNTMNNSIFLNGTLSINLLENLWVDLSIGIFEGRQKDILSKLKNTDFFLIKCKYSF